MCLHALLLKVVFVCFVETIMHDKSLVGTVT